MDYINYLLSIETRGIKLGFERTRAIMKACGNPHLGLPVIQVAGTNGKGSVCAILASILKAAGYKTGLFTSPHLVRVNERIRINGLPIPDAEIDSFIKINSKSSNVGGFFRYSIISTSFPFSCIKLRVCLLLLHLGL